MQDRYDVRVGLRAGLAWLGVSAVLIAVGRALGTGWEGLIGALLVPFGLAGAPGQLAVAWGSIQKPAAARNGAVAGGLAGLSSAAAILIVGYPVALAQWGGGSPAAASLFGLLAYTLALVVLVLTIYTSVTLAIVEAPAAEFPLDGDTKELSKK